MVRKYLLTILAALSFGVAAIAHPPGHAYACSCVQAVPPAEAAAQSEAVFTGTVAAVASQGGDQAGMPVLVTFNIDQVWKGPSAPQLTLGTSGSSASCGYEFVNGEKYIVYAFAQEGQLSTGLCTRTAPLAGAAADLAALGPGAPPTPDTATPVAEPAPASPVLPLSIIVVAITTVAALGIARARRGKAGATGQ